MITLRTCWRAAAGLARWRPAGARGRAVAAALAAAVAAGGCSTVPTSGPVQQVGAGQIGISQENPQPIPVPPGPGWTARQIVSGFLAASASFAGDHAVAREYLDSIAQHSWKPGWAVTVVSTTTTSNAPAIRRQVSGQVQELDQVKVTGLPVATLTGTGLYLASPGSSSESYYYSLAKINGQWRIDSLPKSQLLLTETDFEQVYQPRDLYFLTPSGRTLVPDPVFVPQQATTTELAVGLVKALLENRDEGWLAGAAVSGFPPKAWLIGNQVTINGSNAIVNLGEKPVTSSRRQLEQMAAQLAWTLASGASTTIQAVELQINGRPMQISGNLYQLPQTFRGWVPPQPGGSSLYFVGSHGVVQELSGIGPPGSGRVGTVPGPAGTSGKGGTPALSSIAVSPDRRWVAGITADGGAVYHGDLSRGARLQLWQPTSGNCTSVSWDEQGDLWVAAGGDVWILPPGGTSASFVTPNGGAPGDDVTQFRVAPDGVRAAMIVHGMADGRPVSQVQVAAITHSGTSATVGQPVTIGSAIPDPEALSWYGTDDVIVLSGSSSGAQLYEVPLNGGQPTAIAAPDGDPVSVTATNPDESAGEIALGMSDGKIMIAADQGAFEPVRAVAAGLAPAYPG
jgi:Lipoprotein LpqB beta-propeller domain/Sporulation and spore germination